MHRYQPRIHLVRCKTNANIQITDLDKEEHKTFIFPEAIFTAVTAYQNQLVSANINHSKKFSNLKVLLMLNANKKRRINHA